MILGTLCFTAGLLVGLLLGPVIWATFGLPWFCLGAAVTVLLAPVLWPLLL